MTTYAAVTAAPRSLSARWLRLDALMSGSSGALAVAGAPLLDSALGVSTLFLVLLGGFLLAFAGSLLFLARSGAPAAAVRAVAAGNGLWAVASVVVVATDVLTLTAAGTVITLVQAGAVALVALAQWAAAR